MPDVMLVTILDDGTIKAETGRITGPNHLSAEAFMRESAKLAGGKVEIKRKQPEHKLSQAQGNTVQH